MPQTRKIFENKQKINQIFLELLSAKMKQQKEFKPNPKRFNKSPNSLDNSDIEMNERPVLSQSLQKKIEQFQAKQATKSKRRQRNHSLSELDSIMEDSLSSSFKHIQQEKLARKRNTVSYIPDPSLVNLNQKQFNKLLSKSMPNEQTKYFELNRQTLPANRFSKIPVYQKPQLKPILPVNSFFSDELFYDDALNSTSDMILNDFYSTSLSEYSNSELGYYTLPLISNTHRASFDMYRSSNNKSHLLNRVLQKKSPDPAPMPGLLRSNSLFQLYEPNAKREKRVDVLLVTPKDKTFVKKKQSNAIPIRRKVVVVGN